MNDVARRREEGLRRRSRYQAATRRAATTTATTADHDDLPTELEGLRAGPPRAAAADRAAAPRVPVGPRADRAHDRPAHGRGGVRGRRRGARRRRREAARRARRPALPGLLPRAAARGAGRRRPRAGRARRAREARAPAPARVRRRRGATPPSACSANWERIKREQEGREGIFHDVPEALPALLYARKMQQRAKAVGFEYPDVDGALADLDDELRELKEEPSRATSSATSSSRRSTSRGSSTSIPSSSCGAPRSASAAAWRLPRSSRARGGENWSELPLERQDHYFDLAKETPNERDRRRPRPPDPRLARATRRSRSRCCSTRARSAARSVPSGASTGVHEAVELRDGGDDVRRQGRRAGGGERQRRDRRRGPRAATRPTRRRSTAR